MQRYNQRDGVSCQFYHFTPLSSLKAKELEVVDVDIPFMFVPYLAEKSQWEQKLGSVQTHLYEHDEYWQWGGSATSFTSIKEPSRAFLSKWKAREQREPDISQDGIVCCEAVNLLLWCWHSTLKLKFYQVRSFWTLHYLLHQLYDRGTRVWIRNL